MNRFDLCANSATLTAEQRVFANDTLWAKLQDVADLYTAHGARGNLYLGGSVGLRQPSLLVSQGRTVGMKSDLDLFYLLPDLPPGPADQAFLQAVTALPQDLEVSVHVMPAVPVKEQLHSVAYDDIVKSLRQPVLQGFELGDSPPSRFEAKTLAQMAARMVGTGIAPYYVATHQYANLPGDRIERDAGTMVKASITILRLLCYESLAENFSYAAMLRLADEGFYDGVCSRDLMHEVVRRREQVDLEAPPLEICLRELFSQVAARDLGLSPSCPTHDICAAFRARYLGDQSTRDSLHALLLPLALWSVRSSPELLFQARLELERPDFPVASLGPLHERLSALLAQAEPSSTGILEVVAELVHLCMKSVTDSVKEKLARAYAQAHPGEKN